MQGTFLYLMKLSYLDFTGAILLSKNKRWTSGKRHFLLHVALLEGFNLNANKIEVSSESNLHNPSKKVIDIAI